MVVNIPDLSIEMEVRHEKINAAKIPGVEVQTVLRRISTGELAYSGYIGDTHKGIYVLQEGKRVEIPKEDAAYHQIIEGVEQADTIEQFTKTKVIEIMKTVPMSKIDAYFIESAEEIWAENIPALYKFAEYLDKTDQIGVTQYTNGRGFKMFTALLYPHIENGKFLLVMALTRSQMTYSHLLPIVTEPIVQPSKGKVAKIKTLDI